MGSPVRTWSATVAATPSRTVSAASLLSVSPPFAERGEEARTDLQTEGVDEQDQTELLEEVQQVCVDVHAQVAESDADEKNARNAQRYAGDFRLAEHDAQGDDQCQNQHGVGHSSAPQRFGAPQELFEQFHTKSVLGPHAPPTHAKCDGAACKAGTQIKNPYRYLPAETKCLIPRAQLASNRPGRSSD